MRVAVLSGKGGTGKTFVSVNLSYVLNNCTYCDCDVEEPNGALFLKPKIEREEKVFVTYPSFNKEKCVGCRKCVDFCKFNALMYIKGKPMLFREMCHSCGGCKLVCDHFAVEDEVKEVGNVKIGKSGAINVLSGTLNIGEPSANPIIECEHNLSKDDKMVVIDCPPGSSCAVMESIKNANYCIIVTEPTAFAFSNFQMVFELCTLLNKKCGVVINKSECEYPLLNNFLKDNNVEILCKIPFDKEIAKCLSNGEIASEHFEKYRKIFEDLSEKVGGKL